MIPKMSILAWAQFGQLAKQAWQDGDLISKCGRTELLELGLAERVPVYGIKHLMENRLTRAGLAIAAHLQKGGEQQN